MRGQQWDNVETKKRETSRQLRSITFEGCKGYFDQWKQRQDKCIATNGEYFEGDKIDKQQIMINKFYFKNSLIYCTFYVLGTQLIKFQHISEIQRNLSVLGSLSQYHNFIVCIAYIFLIIILVEFGTPKLLLQVLIRLNESSVNDQKFFSNSPCPHYQIKCWVTTQAD